VLENISSHSRDRGTDKPLRTHARAMNHRRDGAVSEPSDFELRRAELVNSIGDVCFLSRCSRDLFS
jgi:hypothetical protein